MLILTLTVLFSIILLIVRVVKKVIGNKNGGNDFKELTNTQTSRFIYAYDIDEHTLQEAVDNFIHLYSDKGDIERPAIDQEDECIRLTFSPNVDYISLCYWVNYLVHADESKQHRYLVRGWYPFGEVQINGTRQPFSNQIVMLYVDKNDTGHDNISFVTPDGKHYLQPFAIGNNLKPQDDGSDTYRLAEEYRQQHGTNSTY